MTLQRQKEPGEIESILKNALINTSIKNSNQLVLQKIEEGEWKSRDTVPWTLFIFDPPVYQFLFHSLLYNSWDSIMFSFHLLILLLLRKSHKILHSFEFGETFEI